METKTFSATLFLDITLLFLIITHSCDNSHNKTFHIACLWRKMLAVPINQISLVRKNFHERETIKTDKVYVCLSLPCTNY